MQSHPIGLARRDWYRGCATESREGTIVLQTVEILACGDQQSGRVLDANT
jgi:hypothetical protein